MRVLTFFFDELGRRSRVVKLGYGEIAADKGMGIYVVVCWKTRTLFTQPVWLAMHTLC